MIYVHVTFLHEDLSNDEVIFQSTESDMRLEKEQSTERGLKIRFLKSYDPDEPQGKKVFHVGKETIRKLFDEKLDAGPNGKKKWVRTRDIVGAGRATLTLGVYKSFWQFCDDRGVFDSSDGKVPHVLIIDEINRGNVS